MVKYTWTIVPLHLFNFGMLRTQRFTENSPKGTQSPLKREKKKDLLPIGSWGKRKKLPQVIKTEFLLSISIQYQAEK